MNNPATKEQATDLAIYRDELTGGGLRILCHGCVAAWEAGDLDLPDYLGDLNDLSQLMQRCEACEGAIPKPRPVGRL